MKSLLFNSLLILSLFLSASCTSQNQKKSDISEEDTAQHVIPDTIKTTESDTIIPLKVPGDSVKAQSSQTQSSEPGTPSKNPGAIQHHGPNQSETDSIKKVKTKRKK